MKRLAFSAAIPHDFATGTNAERTGLATLGTSIRHLFLLFNHGTKRFRLLNAVVVVGNVCAATSSLLKGVAPPSRFNDDVQ